MIMSDRLHELDQRSHDGVDVRLLWRKRDNHVFVVVNDGKTGGRFEIEVRAGERALDVFHHPYAYAALRGIDTGADTAEAMSWAA
jgi:hypothetical protein